MSIANTPSQPSESADYPCERDGCTNTYTAEEAVAGSYCSPACHQRERGRDLLNVFQHDHRWCYTCFRRLKRVTDVPEWRRRRLGAVTNAALTGYQSRTQHARLGQVARRRDRYQFETQVGTVCECGNANTREREDIVRGSDLRATVTRFLAAVEATRREGQHDHQLDARVLTTVLRLQWRYGRDWSFERAVGAAMEAHDA
jgi:hypothetical protein